MKLGYKTEEGLVAKHETGKKRAKYNKLLKSTKIYINNKIKHQR